MTTTVRQTLKNGVSSQRHDGNKQKLGVSAYNKATLDKLTKEYCPVK